MDLDRRFGDDAKVSLIAEQPDPRWHTGGVAGCRMECLDIAGGRHKGCLENDILNVAVTILLHTTGICGNPTPQSGQFDAVRIVARGKTEGAEFALQFLARDTGFDRGLQILVVEQQNVVHPSHIDGDDDALLVLGQTQRATDIGATTIWDQTHTVCYRGVHDVAYIRLAFGEHYAIDDATEGSQIEQTIDLVDAELTVAVYESIVVFGGDLVVVEMLTQ